MEGISSNSAKSSSATEEVSRSMDVDLDRISTLPAHMIEQILSGLSLRDAVRTSVLSRKWKNRWTTLPRLVFDNDLLPPKHGEMCLRKLIRFIDTILLLHRGPKKSFRLDHMDLPSITDIDRWLLHLSRFSVNELRIRINEIDYYDEVSDSFYDIPGCLFAWQDLVYLDLYQCKLKPPCEFAGFKNLRRLTFSRVAVSRDNLEYLISSCPQLIRLSLVLLDNITRLRIDAPNLQRLKVHGPLEALHLNIDSLVSLKLSLFYHPAADASYRYLHELFPHLSQVRYLYLGCCSLKYLSVGGVPNTLPNSLLCLKHLLLDVNLSCVNDIAFTLCMLRSTPNLERVEFLAHTKGECDDVDAVTKFLEDNMQFPPLFKRLKTVCVLALGDNQEMQFIKALGDNKEMELIKFMLLSSPVLEKMIIRPSSIEDGFELLRQLVQFPRSNGAQVVCVYPDDFTHDSIF